MRKIKAKLTLSKKILFSVIPLILILVVGEVGLRILFFQMTSDEPTAFGKAYSFAQMKFLQAKAKSEVESVGMNFTKYQDFLYSDQGVELREELQKKYEQYFKEFAREVKLSNSKLLVVYIPSDNYKEHNRLEIQRTFFYNLTSRYNIDFIDLTDEFLKYDPYLITLIPYDGHLSRFGNYVVASELSKYIETIKLDSKKTYEDRPSLLGGLRPNDNSIWQVKPNMPYRVITNSQGLRMEYDLEFPKLKPRILILGDSYTFGPYLNNHDTFSARLDSTFEDIEIINAGVASYSIPDQLDLFQNNAKYTEPDLVILQVLDNDVSDLFYLKRQINGIRIQQDQLIPTQIEEKYIKELVVS